MKLTGPLREIGLAYLSRQPAVTYLLVVRPMKTTIRSTFVGMTFATMLFASGCQKKTAVTNAGSESTPESTKPLQAAGLVGYDGTGLRKSVDRMKEANEKHNEQLEKTAESGPDQ